MTLNRLKVAHISPASGGVSHAAQRLHQGLVNVGVESHFFTTAPLSLPNVTVLKPQNRLIRYADSASKLIDDRFGLAGLLHLSSLLRSFAGFDVLHFHGMDASWYNLGALPRLNRDHAIVFTMHDKHLGTGACGFPEMFGNCERWRTGCGDQCPKAKKSGWWIDPSRFVYRRKGRLIPATNAGIIALNRWMVDFLDANPITQNQPIRVIPNGVDTGVFTPSDRGASRAEFSLPADRRLILFVAADLAHPRKGVQHYLPLVRELRARTADCGIVFVGAKLPPKLQADLSALAPVYALGTIKDPARLARVFGACDLFVVPSVIDNQPSVVLESLASGTPVAGFRVGGIPDMVEHGVNGLLSSVGAVDELAEHIAALFADEAQYAALRAASRQIAVERYTLERQASAHIDFYRELLAVRQTTT